MKHTKEELFFKEYADKHFENGYIYMQDTEKYNICVKTTLKMMQEFAKQESVELLECLDYVLGSFSLERTENFELLNKCKKAIKKATEN